MPDFDDLFVLVAVLLFFTGVLPLIGTIILVTARTWGKVAAQQKDGSVHVPLIASQIAVRGLPWLVWTFNFWTPKLTLHADALEWRGFRLQRRTYAEIARVGYSNIMGMQNVIIDFPDRRWSFQPWVPNRKGAQELIRQLQNHGCALSPRAARLLRSA